MSGPDRSRVEYVHALLVAHGGDFGELVRSGDAHVLAMTADDLCAVDQLMRGDVDRAIGEARLN